jgi:hypothetical protein
MFRESISRYAKSTPRYAAYRGVLTKNLIADSTLSKSTRNSIQNILIDSALCGTAQSRLPAIQHSAELRGVNTYSRISLQNRNQIRKYFRMIISDLWRVDL